MTVYQKCRQAPALTHVSILALPISALYDILFHFARHAVSYYDSNCKPVRWATLQKYRITSLLVNCLHQICHITVLLEQTQS